LNRDPYPGEEDPVEFEDIWGEPVMVRLLFAMYIFLFMLKRVSNVMLRKLVLAKDVSPERNQFVATLTTLISLACIGIFSVEAFSATPDVMSHLQASYDSGDSDLSWLTPRVIPIFFYFLATQLAHEIGHQLFALKGKVCTWHFYLFIYIYIYIYIYMLSYITCCISLRPAHQHLFHPPRYHY